MPNYQYKVRDKAGRIVQGQLDAGDEKELRRKLAEREYFIIDYSRSKNTSSILTANIFPWATQIGLMDIAVFSWQLCTLLGAGLTLVNSLRTLIAQSKKENLKQVLTQVCQRVEGGSTLADALKEHPAAFSRLYVQMVNAGEIGGVLEQMVSRLALFYERQAEIRSKLIPALVYPGILLFLSFAVILFLVVVVLPQFATIFHEIGVPIPVPTQVLLSLSLMVKDYGLLVFGVVVGGIVLARFFLATSQGSYMFHAISMNLPVVGTLVRKMIAVRFTQTLATLAGSGIPILTSLDVVTDVVENKVAVQALKKVAQSVGEGKTMAQPLEETGLFPEMVISMVRVGEETGSLETMLNKVADFYYKDVNTAIDAFAKLVEPALMVTMAVIIGFIALAIFMPMANLLQNIH